MRRIAVCVVVVALLGVGCFTRGDDGGESTRACAAGIGIVESQHCGPAVQLAGAPVETNVELARLQAASHAEYVRVQLSELRGRCRDGPSVSRVGQLEQTCLARLDRTARAP